MSGHTPGPWHIDPSWRGFADYIRDIHGRLMAQVGPFPENDYRANARLIAAAPDLLAALEGLLHEVRQETCGAESCVTCAARERARAAMRAARGTEDA